MCTFCGTYGMGGPGFFGFELQGDYGTGWLTYCIWSAGEHVLFDSNSKPHSIQSYKFSAGFLEQGGTGQKRNSFETGEMKDYLLVTYDETHLVV